MELKASHERTAHQSKGSERHLYCDAKTGKWEGGSDIGPSKHEPHNDTSHQNLDPSSRFDFNKIPIFPSSNANLDLPADLQFKMETAFRENFSNVGIQKNSLKALELNALAYTQGENVHFAPGQFNPFSENGRNLIGHEFTQVAQQRSGIVKPTSLMGRYFDLNESSRRCNKKFQYRPNRQGDPN